MLKRPLARIGWLAPKVASAFPLHAAAYKLLGERSSWVATENDSRRKEISHDWPFHQKGPFETARQRTTTPRNWTYWVFENNLGDE